VTELCFSEFAKCVQKSLQPPNNDMDTVTLLLKWITDKPNVLDKKNNPINIDPKMVSELLSRKIDVHKSIKDACSTKAILSEAIKHCEKKILPSLNPIVSDDMYEAMNRAVMADETMASRKKKKLNQMFDDGKEAEFLANLLMYVINRDNRNPNIPVSETDIPFLAEVNYKCPICQRPLVEALKNTQIRRYGIVHIYPDSIKELDSQFSTVKKPKNINISENKIALCIDHADAYEADTTFEDYLKLKKLKQSMAALYSVRMEINSSSLDEEIKDILIALANIPANANLEELSMDALRLDQKILSENILLLNDEMTRVLRYYHYIEELFAAMEREGTGDFDLIASEIRTAYKKLTKSQLSQEEIVNELAEWIKNKSNVGDRNMRACHIIVAYFIQNCEVFDEISK